MLVIVETVNIKKVKFSAKQETDYIHNFKLLQDSFNAAGVRQVFFHPVPSTHNEVNLLIIATTYYFRPKI